MPPLLWYLMLSPFSNSSGVTTSVDQFEIQHVGTIVFIGNTAFDFGGALSLANPAKLNISDSAFRLNEAESGGAVSLTSTVRETAGFHRCQFETNKGTDGGALHLNGEGKRFLQESYFRLNVAGETSSKGNYSACQTNKISW